MFRTNRPQRAAPVTTQLLGQIQNSDGGFVYQPSSKDLFIRALILGSDRPTYYAGGDAGSVIQRTRTIKAIAQYCDDDPKDALQTVHDIVISRRAKNLHASIYAWAYLSKMDNQYTRTWTRAYFNDIIKTAEQLFAFVAYSKELRGFGRHLRIQIGSWFDAVDVGYQAAKYVSRYGWSLADVIRLARPNVNSPLRRMDTEQNQAIIRYLLDKPYDFNQLPPILRGKIAAQRASSEKELIGMIHEYRLTHEMIPTQYRKSGNVWNALLDYMPPWAIVRNLGTLTSHDVIGPLKTRTDFVVNRLIKAADKVHPATYFLAYSAYKRGSSRGGLTWRPIQPVERALEEAFEVAMNAQEPTGKRILVAVDCSPSMYDANSTGLPYHSAEIAAAIAFVLTKRESTSHVIGFGRVPFDLNLGNSITSAVAATRNQNWYSTNLGAPWEYAESHGYTVDAVVSITDNEVNMGQHPAQLAANYRRRHNVDARTVVVATTMNEFSVADPNSMLDLDVAGFDSNVIPLLQQFIGGKTSAEGDEDAY